MRRSDFGRRNGTQRDRSRTGHQDQAAQESAVPSPLIALQRLHLLPASRIRRIQTHGFGSYGAHTDVILDNLMDLKEDGSLAMDRLLQLLPGLTMTGPRLDNCLEVRLADRKSAQREMDLAASVQAVTEEAALRMAKTAREMTGSVCLAGGTEPCGQRRTPALRHFRKRLVTPASGDAGGAKERRCSPAIADRIERSPGAGHVEARPGLGLKMKRCDERSMVRVR